MTKNLFKFLIAVITTFIMVSSPLNAQWVWQNPLPQGNDLRGSSYIDANTGTLVG